MLAFIGDMHMSASCGHRRTPPGPGCGRGAAHVPLLVLVPTHMPVHACMHACMNMHDVYACWISSCLLQKPWQDRCLPPR